MDKPGWWRSRGELPGMFRWALEGLAELRRQGGFSLPESCVTIRDQYRRDNNPAMQFLLEDLEVDPSGETHLAKKDIYAAYRRWCDESGPPPSDPKFGVEVMRVFKGKVRSNGKAPLQVRG